MSVKGVESVEVSLEKGLAAVKLKPGNTVTLKQLHDAIAKNGFTMKQSHMVAAGRVVPENGTARFQVSGSNDALVLIPESGVPEPGAASAPSGPNSTARFVVDGTIPGAAKDKIPDTVRYRSLTEER